MWLTDSLHKIAVKFLLPISILFFIPMACKLELNHAYDTRTTEYYKTQIAICIAEQFRNCNGPETATPAPSSLSYAGNPFVFTKYIAITPVVPNVSGNPVSYSVSPVLPTGLTIDSNTGKLSGTPLALVTTTTYTVTATNSGGSVSFPLSITVNFDLLSVPGMRLWLKAEGLGLANAASVTNWSDLSGNGNTLVPGVSPNFYSSTNTINGKPVVRFLYGPGHNLSKTSPIGVSASDSGSIFLVARVITALNNNVLRIGPTGGRELQITSGGGISLNKAGQAVVASYSASWSAGIVNQISILQNAGTNILFKINGSQVLSTNPAATGYAAGDLVIGFGGAEVDIAELFFFDNRVSDEDAVRIDCYLGNRYGTLSCP